MDKILVGLECMDKNLTEKEQDLEMNLELILIQAVG